MPLLADFARDLGLKRLAVLYINSDWGRTAKDLLVAAVKKRGGEVVAAEGYLADEKDFRSAIVRVRDANPDGIALISYYPDGAQITRQIHNAGLTQPIVAGGSIYSPKFLELGGDAVNGVMTTVPFFPDDPRPTVQKFVQGFDAKFAVEPDAYNGRAYDTFDPAGRGHARSSAPNAARSRKGWQDQGRAERRLRLRHLRSGDAPRRQPLRQPDHGQGRQVGGLGRKDLREAMRDGCCTPPGRRLA